MGAARVPVGTAFTEADQWLGAVWVDGGGVPNPEVVTLAGRQAGNRGAGGVPVIVQRLRPGGEIAAGRVLQLVLVDETLGGGGGGGRGPGEAHLPLARRRRQVQRGAVQQAEPVYVGAVEPDFAPGRRQTPRQTVASQEQDLQPGQGAQLPGNVSRKVVVTKYEVLQVGEIAQLGGYAAGHAGLLQPQSSQARKITQLFRYCAAEVGVLGQHKMKQARERP